MFFDRKVLRFIKTDKNNKITENLQEPVILCTDVNELIKKVIEERELDENDLLVRVGLDGGGGFVKVCLSLFNLCSDRPSKILYKKLKDSGVRKSFIIALVREIQENYFNMKTLWLNAGLNKLQWPFVIATDLKLCNILLGLMSHSSTHPCCWCDIDKSQLHKKGKLRTVGNLDALFWTFYDSRAKLDKAKDYGNVVHPSLIVGDKDTPILLVVPPPELHLLIGPVNHITKS